MLARMYHKPDQAVQHGQLAFVLVFFRFDTISRKKWKYLNLKAPVSNSSLIAIGMKQSYHNTSKIT
jgi:hypothetical protein